MAEDMREISRMARKMERAPSFGQMEINISAAGEMINSMVLEFTTTPRMGLRSRASGLTERDISGLTE